MRSSPLPGRAASDPPSPPPADIATTGCWRDAVAALNRLVDSPHLVDLVHSPRAILVHPSGPGLTERDAGRIIDAVTRAFAERAKDARYLVFDVSDVRAMSAFGIGLCCDLAKRADAHELTPILVGARREILDALRMFKAERLYRVVHSRRDLAEMVEE